MMYRVHDDRATTDRPVIMHKRPIGKQQLTAANGATNKQKRSADEQHQSCKVANPDDTSSQGPRAKAERESLMFGA